MVNNYLKYDISFINEQVSIGHPFPHQLDI